VGKSGGKGVGGRINVKDCDYDKRRHAQGPSPCKQKGIKGGGIRHVWTGLGGDQTCREQRGG